MPSNEERDERVCVCGHLAYEHKGPKRECRGIVGTEPGCTCLGFRVSKRRPHGN